MGKEVDENSQMGRGFTFELRALPDELLGSLISRHFAIVTKSAATKLWKYFGRSDPARRVLLPSGLDALFAMLPSKTLSPAGLAAEHTAFPYVSPILSADQRELLLSALRGKTENIGRHYVEPPGRQLLFCPQCRHEQLENQGSASWGRTHQLPGVYNCHLHGKPLHKAGFAPFTSQAMDFLAGASAPSTEVSCPISLDFAGQIARVSHGLLNDAGLQLRMSALSTGIAGLAREEGLIRPDGTVRRDLAKEFSAHFGPEGLRAMGLPMESSSEVLYWTIRGRGVRRPIHLILILLFMGIDPFEVSLSSIPVSRPNDEPLKRAPTHRRTLTDARRLQLRALLQQGIDRGLTRGELEQAYPTPYRILRDLDLEWLEPLLPPRKGARQAWKYHTDAEDLELWPRLKEVCDRHAGSANAPPTRLTKNTILHEANLMRLEKRLSRLPRCQQLIADHAVSLEEHWKRRFEWGVDRATEQGVVMSWTEFTEFVRLKTPRMPQFVEASKVAHRKLLERAESRLGPSIKIGRKRRRPGM